MNFDEDDHIVICQARNAFRCASTGQFKLDSICNREDIETIGWSFSTSLCGFISYSLYICYTKQKTDYIRQVDQKESSPS